MTCCTNTIYIYVCVLYSTYVTTNVHTYTQIFVYIHNLYAPHVLIRTHTHTHKHVQKTMTINNSFSNYTPYESNSRIVGSAPHVGNHRFNVTNIRFASARHWSEKEVNNKSDRLASKYKLFILIFFLYL